MSLAVTELLPGAAVPLIFWLWVLGFLFVASGAGFLAGASFVWLSSRSKLKKSLRAPGNLMPVVREQLEAALEATKALKERKQVVLSEEETSELSHRRDSLLALLNEIVELQQQVAATIEGKPRAGKAGVSIPFEVAWEREPVDELTKLPNAEVMSNNLNIMLAKGTENQRGSGFLFVKLDGFEKLLARHGAEERDTLLKKFASVIIRAVREEDLVCRYETDTIAVLFPSLDKDQGVTLAHVIRKSILNYQFRFSESGPAVILNAHYGYTDCLPHENEDLILNRAGNALAKSQSRGFNQLHVHDGDALYFSGRGS